MLHSLLVPAAEAVPRNAALRQLLWAALGWATLLVYFAARRLLTYTTSLRGVCMQDVPEALPGSQLSYSAWPSLLMRPSLLTAQHQQALQGQHT
jgi:hypothetical protein